MKPDVSTVWDRLEKSISQWANKHPQVVAAVAVGSRVWQTPPADEWSGLDVILFLTDPSLFHTRPNWVDEIGEASLSVAGRTINRDPERLVIFDGGYSVDFVLLPISAIDWLSQHGAKIEPFVRGARVLADKDGRLSQLFPPGFAPEPPPFAPPPSREDYLQGILTFWHTAHHAARILRRGALWELRGVDFQLKEILASTLALHAIVVGKRADVWSQGRFMERWADPQALNDLSQTYWRNEKEAWRALFTTVDIFDRLSYEIATTLGYPFPGDVTRKTAQLLRDLYPG